VEDVTGLGKAVEGADGVVADGADGITADGAEYDSTGVLTKDIAVVDGAAAAGVVATEAAGTAGEVTAGDDTLTSACASGCAPISASTADALDTGSRMVIVRVATGFSSGRLEVVVGAAGSSEMADWSAAAITADGAAGEEESAAPESKVETVVGREANAEEGASESVMVTETSSVVVSVSVVAEGARNETAEGRAEDAVSSAGGEESDGASATKSAAVW
jgi:hypothetical protein